MFFIIVRDHCLSLSAVGLKGTINVSLGCQTLRGDSDPSQSENIPRRRVCWTSSWDCQGVVSRSSLGADKEEVL